MNQTRIPYNTMHRPVTIGHNIHCARQALVKEDFPKLYNVNVGELCLQNNSGLKSIIIRNCRSYTGTSEINIHQD